jgi:hypothetical protein
LFGSQSKPLQCHFLNTFSKIVICLLTAVNLSKSRGSFCLAPVNLFGTFFNVEHYQVFKDRKFFPSPSHYCYIHFSATKFALATVVVTQFRTVTTTYNPRTNVSSPPLITVPPPNLINQYDASYSGTDKSLARLGRKQATATEYFDVHISYL